jgi:predicted amidohydrolase
MNVDIHDKDVNIHEAQRVIEKAAENGANLVVLPEIWNSPYKTSAFRKNAEMVPEGPSSTALSQAAKSSAVWLVGGSIPEISEGNVYNTCAIYNPDGELVAKHRKVHLFDIDIPGKIQFRESDTLTAGNDITVFDSPWGKVGVGICYDMRFQEMAAVMRQRGAQILVYPGAFNLTTGPLHWELLQRGRANDTQSFVLTASPARGGDVEEYQVRQKIEPSHQTSAHGDRTK